MHTNTYLFICPIIQRIPPEGLLCASTDLVSGEQLRSFILEIHHSGAYAQQDISLKKKEERNSLGLRKRKVTLIRLLN